MKASMEVELQYGTAKTNGLGFLKELKSVFRKGSRKKRDYAVWETIEQLELDF